MSPQQIYVVHGYQASPDNHWFPWLKKTLSAQGHTVSIIPMPIPHAPRLHDWIETLSHCIGIPDKNSFIVAHSLGCISVLQYLSQLPAAREIGGLLLVAGFSDNLEEIPQLDHFCEPRLKIDQIKRLVPQRVVIASENDNVVPFHHSHRLSQQLAAPLHRVSRGGHFLGSDGFTEFPLAESILKSMFVRAGDQPG